MMTKKNRCVHRLELTNFSAHAVCTAELTNTETEGRGLFCNYIYIIQACQISNVYVHKCICTRLFTSESTC